MTRKGSWKSEFDRKYNHLLSMGSISVIDRANDILLQAIEGLDRILKEISEQGHPYNLKKEVESGQTKMPSLQLSGDSLQVQNQHPHVPPVRT